VAIYTYKRYISPKINPKYVPNKEFLPEGETKTTENATLYFFYTTWCPHCKQTLKDWEIYRTSSPLEGGTYSVVDCDKFPDKADFYQIESYPTIIMVVKDKKYIFDSNFSKESMDKFVDTILKL
jgi:thiol-disulfide isomerase/thioredoxin